jgi:hypothetical protein
MEDDLNFFGKFRMTTWGKKWKTTEKNVKKMEDDLQKQNGRQHNCFL